MSFPKHRDFASKIMIPAEFHCSTSLQTQFCQKNISSGNVFLINHFTGISIVSITARLLIICSSFLLLFQNAAAQNNTPVFKNAIAANRTKTYNNIVKNIIAKNLSLPLTDSTEENWQDAFYAMEVLQYKQPWVLQKIKTAFDAVEKRSAGFQRALLELAYTNQLFQFKNKMQALFSTTANAKIFGMCAAFLLKADKSLQNTEKVGSAVYKKNTASFDNPAQASYISYEILWPIMQLAEKESNKIKFYPEKLGNKSFLRNNMVVYSLQRKNRNYPGIAIIRDSTGKFVTDSSGNIFSVQQLARSITNLPGYLTNGNTPQGIFRMNGFAVSRSAAIGPTENIQLLMPLETTPQYFLKDSTITDTAWTKELYGKLLPAALKNYHPLYGTYYASAIGRTEIIAHGTTVDPAFYKNESYYPHTPTQGCLCTKEIWSSIDGKRTESNQQKLVDALKKAGGANGYLIVIEIDDQQKPVTIEDVKPFLKN